MASNRHFARILIMQALYEWQHRDQTPLDKVMERHLAEHEFEENNLTFIWKIVKSLPSHLEEIDQVITVSAPEWPIPQIAQVDLAIMRLAIFELLFDNEVPPKAVINEAVELAKSFGGENSSKFVNGVLGTVFRNSTKYDPLEDKRRQAEAGQTATPIVATEPEPTPPSQ
jgi:N utilization substance protein B